MHQNWGKKIFSYVALWDQRIFPRALLPKAWSVDQQHSAFWEVGRNAEPQAHSRSAESESASN